MPCPAHVSRIVHCLVAFALAMLSVCCASLLDAQQAQAASLAPCSESAVATVRALIEALPSCSDVTEEDGPAIAQARAAYDQLEATERTLLDTETNRAALGTTQSYGRVLELAEAGYAVLHAVDSSTALSDGLYKSGLATSWDRGKSASKQDREWVATAVRVQGGKAQVTLQVNSSTYSYVRVSGQVVKRSTASSANESLFTFPISLGKQMTFTAYSQTMAAEIAYNLTVSVPAGAKPDAALPADDDPETGSGNEPGASDAPQTHVDAATGCVIVEAGTFTHPEIKGYMFRIVAPARLTSDGQSMEAFVQMPSANAYSHLFVGTKAEADAKTLQEEIDEGSAIAATFAANGEGTTASSFTFPLESLDRDITICTYSIKNQRWVENTIRFNSSDLARVDKPEDEQLASVVELLANLPARNTIVPDNAEHEATVKAAREAYDALDENQKAQVPAQLVLLLEWDESMFELGFNTDFLPMATAGVPYDGAIYVSGKNGGSDKVASVISGKLPDGLSLQMDDAGLWAHFVGTPTSNGTSTFTVQLENALGERVSKEFTIHVGYAPIILTDKLADAVVGSAYRQDIVANAYPDATWSLTAGSLPKGLRFADGGEASNAARIEGTPTEAGAFTFTLTCDNYANGTERKDYSLTVHEEKPEAAASAARKPISINSKVVSAKVVRAALKKAGSPRATTAILGKKVKRIEARAFAKTSIDTLIVETAKLTGKSVKGSLRSSAVKTIEVSTGKATQAKTKKAYKRIFAKANCGKNVRVV